MTTSTGLVAATPTSEIAIARVGDERWMSFHAFCPTDRNALLMQAIQPVVAAVWAERIADRFFFIRYPEGGDHIRLRLRVAPGVATETATHRAFALLRASCDEFRRALPGLVEQIVVVPAVFEPEVDRYGGPRWLPCALAFFALSSMDALQFVAQWRREPRARQLVEILARLTRQAVGMARTASELRSLADYVVESRPGMASMFTRADQIFDARGPQLTRQIRQVLVAARAAAAVVPGSPDAQIARARCLSAAVDGLESEARWRALGSQMHMTANRLGLNRAEESYLSGILCRCLDALGDELADLMAAPAGRDGHGPAGESPAAALDALAAEGMTALFDSDQRAVAGEAAS